MPSPNVAALRAEMEAQVADLSPPLEGMRDYVRLARAPDEADMKAETEKGVVAFQSRLDDIDVVTKALDRLEKGGFPEVPERRVAQAIYDKLTQNRATIEAAHARFAPILEAEGGSFNLGPGVDK